MYWFWINPATGAVIQTLYDPSTWNNYYVYRPQYNVPTYIDASDNVHFVQMFSCGSLYRKFNVNFSIYYSLFYYYPSCVNYLQPTSMVYFSHANMYLVGSNFNGNYACLTMINNVGNGVWHYCDPNGLTYYGMATKMAYLNYMTIEAKPTYNNANWVGI